jgi:hypothetical protein
MHIVRVLKNVKSAEDQLQIKACGSILKGLAGSRVLVRVRVRDLGLRLGG